MLDRSAEDGLLDGSAPSRLPGWSVGHVLTHLARNADSIGRVLAAADRGETVARYAPGQRDAEIESGATRPADELVADVRAAIERAGVAPAGIVVELTESALMRDVVAMTARLSALRELGVKIAIDDFGTGYSSLARLRWLPIDILKIDRSFIAGVDTDEHGLAMVRAVCALAEAMELDVVVEGVEREGQARVLAGLGLRHAQGFLYSPAVPSDQLDRLLGTPASPGASPRQLRATAG